MKHIIIKGTTYQVPTNEKEVTIAQYFNYISILETYKDWLTAINNGELEIEDDYIIKELSFNIDMICAVSNIPKEELENNVPSTQILHISKFILSEELEDETYLTTTFEFIDYTPQEIQEVKDKLKGTKWYRIDQKIILSYRLYKMQKPVLFLVAPDLAKETLSQWIVTESLRKKIVQAAEGMKNGMYENISKIIAYISKRPNEDYCEKTAEHRAEVFKHLPLHTAHQIASFFLMIYSEYNKTFKTSLTERTMTKITKD